MLQREGEGNVSSTVSDKMPCFDLKGRFCLAFKHFPCRIAKNFIAFI